MGAHVGILVIVAWLRFRLKAGCEQKGRVGEEDRGEGGLDCGKKGQPPAESLLEEHIQALCHQGYPRR